MSPKSETASGNNYPGTTARQVILDTIGLLVGGIVFAAFVAAVCAIVPAGGLLG